MIWVMEDSAEGKEWMVTLGVFSGQMENDEQLKVFFLDEVDSGTNHLKLVVGLGLWICVWMMCDSAMSEER